MACTTLNNVPDLHCFVVTPTGQQISIGIEIDTEDVICVTCKGPDTNSLSMKGVRTVR